MKTITWPARQWRIGRWPGRWLSRTPENGDRDENGDQGDEGRTDPPPFGVPPSEEGRSGNLGPPPPDLLRDLTGSGSDAEPPPYEVARQGGGRRGVSRQNLNTTVLLELLEHFDVAWRRDLEDYVNGERKDDLDSIVINRHLNRTRSALRDLPVQVSDYYLRVKEIIAYMDELCA